MFVARSVARQTFPTGQPEKTSLTFECEGSEGASHRDVILRRANHKCKALSQQ